MSVTVLTGLFGGYDTLKEPIEQTVDTNFVCVTDNADLTSPTWQIRVQPNGNLHPRTEAKRPKFHPWVYSDSDTVIWLDASAEIISPRFVADMIEAVNGDGIAQFDHPARDCIYEELKASVPLRKYRDHSKQMTEQVSMYQRQGHPANWGLWATGVIVYRLVSDLPYLLGGEWWQHCLEFSYQDQLSEAPILRGIGIRPRSLPYGLVANPWLSWHPHVSDL